MKTIIISAQLANGKDVAGNYLSGSLYAHTGDSWKVMGFAHAVKDVFCRTFGVNREFVEEWKRKPECPPMFDIPVRQALQQIGHGFRLIRSSIWIDIALQDEGENKIICDGRYRNEALAGQKMGALNLLLYRPGFLNDDPNPSESELKPVIEWYAESGLEGDVRQIKRPKGPDLYDFFIRNDGDLAGLYHKLEKWIVPAVLD